MPLKSPFPDLDIPKSNVLTYLFPPGQTPSDVPIWIDAANPSKNLTPRQLLQWVKRLAVGLQRLRIKPGEVVMIYTPNHIYVPVAYLAVVGYGAAFTGANPAYTVPEMIHQIKSSEAKTILVHPNLVKNAVAATKEAGLSKSRIFLFSDQESAPIDGVLDWRKMIGTSGQGERWQWDLFTPEQACTTIATINYSSGTTGLPKGVMVSHYNLIANVEQIMFNRYHQTPYTYRNCPPERWVGFLPLYHAYGQLYTILVATKMHVPIYIMENFQYERFLSVIQDYKITHLQTAPPILIMLSKRPETKKYDISSVKEILCGAAPVPHELKSEVAKRLSVPILLGWGMTEVTCSGIAIPGGMDDDSGSVGFLSANMEGKLLDDDEKEVGPEERGELYVRGPNICLGYWRDPRSTKESIDEEGWLKTGDVAVRNEMGMFWIVDRLKELIKVNALQVAPAELEGALLEHHDVADVAVVGITIHGLEWPRAYVTLKDESKGNVTEKEIADWMKQRLAKHKWLEGGVMFVDEVPKLASGKIQRKVMREWAKRDAVIIEGQGPTRARL